MLESELASPVAPKQAAFQEGAKASTPAADTIMWLRGGRFLVTGRGVGGPFVPPCKQVKHAVEDAFVAGEKGESPFSFPADALENVSIYSVDKIQCDLGVL